MLLQSPTKQDNKAAIVRYLTAEEGSGALAAAAAKEEQDRKKQNKKNFSRRKMSLMKYGLNQLLLLD